MVVFPNAKINLGLSVIGKRSDGFHELQTVFYPIRLCDALEVVSAHPSDSSARENNFPGLHFSSSGLSIDGDAKNNLCVRAYEMLAADFAEVRPVQLHLHKHIPMGAGLGGGSSDAAFTLVLLNNLFQLQLRQQQLIDYAARLGSDCPFFVINKPCFATSRGEIMEEVGLDLSSFSIVLVNPGVHINTGWAFSALDLTRERTGALSLKELIQSSPFEWRNQLTNDFEEAVFAAHPALAEIKQQLYSAGAVYASMSGSGSTLFGLFETGTTLPFAFPAHYRVIYA